MKKRFFSICLLLGINAITINADYLQKGVIMCNNADSIRKLVDLDSNNDPAGFINYYSQMESMRICSQTIAAMTPSSLGRTDLSGGVTRIGDSIFVITSEIK